MSGVPLKVIKDWKEGMTQEERERVIGEQKLTEEQVATLDATAHARALAEAAGDRTLTLEEEVVEINRQIEKLGEADEAEAVQMLDAELQAEEEAARAEEEAASGESPKAEEETRNEGEGAPRAEIPAEAKPDAGGGEAVAGRELDALRVRAAELDDRLRAKGLRKAERAKISEELSGVRARMHELSGGDLVLFSRGEAAAGRPALSPTKAALRDRLLLKIAQTAGIRVIREGSEAIAASAARAQGEARYKKENDRFNAELEAFEKRASNNVIHLGVPGEILRACGLNDTEMFIRPKVLRSHMNTHGINIADVRNLPGALNNPLMVYEWGTKARSLIVITDLTLKDGRKITAAVKLERNGKAAEVNELASVHGKDAARFIRDMENAKSGGLEKALRYVSDKEKALAWLGNVPPRGTTEAPQGLHLQKIIEDFENPSIKNIRFRREAFPATTEEREGIEREAKAKGTWLKAPNGNPTKLTPEQWVTVRTRAFKEWFGDWEHDPANASKVVDGNGEPLVVWHGTREHFYEFEHGRAFGSGDIYGYLGHAFYATNDYETAETYADGGYKRTLGLFLNIRNPYETKNPDHTSPAHGGSFAKHLGVSPREVSPTLRQMGHDGVIATDEEAGYIEYAFYHSTQAKSATENVGTFDAGNPDIRYSLGGGKVLRDGEGVVYGYWDEGRGELHLNEDFADFDTPLHEWAHVWLSWVRKADARKYASSVAFDLAENFLQTANRGEGIIAPADGAHDGEVSRAGAEHGGQPRFVNPADGDGGAGRGVDHFAHCAEPERRVGNFLRRRGVDGTDADVVGSGGARGGDLRGRVRGESENFQRREAFPRGGQRHVVLSEMHAVGFRFRGDFGIVVHDEERARSRSDAANVFRGFEDAFPRRALHAQLNEAQSRAHGGVRAGFMARRGIRDDEVKAEGIFHEGKKEKTRERGDRARRPGTFPPSSFFSASNLRR